MPELKREFGLVYDIIVVMKRFFVILTVLVSGFAVVPVGAITKKQENAIVDHCESIREDLKNVQKNDARVRVHLGSGYETILSKFIMPLNVRLVEDNLSNAELVENQNNFAEAKVKFTTDYIDYQQGLEELILVDCKKNPEEFYKKLGEVRQGRKTVAQDVVKLESLIKHHVKLVTGLKEKVK